MERAQPSRSVRPPTAEGQDVAGAVAGMSLALVVIVAEMSGFALHVYATYLAFRFSGIVAAVMTFALPFIAEIYWFVRAWSLSGTYLNLYCMSATVVAVLWIARGVVKAKMGDHS